jgi:hypothetical protein
MKVVMGIAAGVVALILMTIVLSAIFSGDDTEIAETPPAAEPSDATALAPDSSPPAEPSQPSFGPFAPDLVPRQDDVPSQPTTTPPTTIPPASDTADSAVTAEPFVPSQSPAASPEPSSLSSLPEKPALAASQSSFGPLPSAVDRWYAAAGPLRGARPVENEDFVVFHYGWMCELLPFLGHGDLYDKFDFRKPWMDEENAKLCTTLIPEFLNPADDRQKWTGSQFLGLTLTHFVGMSGAEDGRNVVAATLPRNDPRAGIFGYREVARRGEITDGASQTIMLVGSGEIVAPWVQGGGATVRGARPPYFDPLTGFGSRGLATKGTVVLMADGSTRHLSADMDPAVFRALCTIRGGDAVDVGPLGPVAADFPGTQPASGGRQPPVPAGAQPRRAPSVRPW